MINAHIDGIRRLISDGGLVYAYHYMITFYGYRRRHVLWLLFVATRVTAHRKLTKQYC